MDKARRGPPFGGKKHVRPRLYANLQVKNSFGGRPSVDFQDACRFYDGRFFLPVCKPLSSVAIDIYPGKLFSIAVVDGDLPVAMFPPAVAAQSAPLLAPLFFHGSIDLCDRHYVNFEKAAQVTI